VLRETPIRECAEVAPMIPELAAPIVVQLTHRWTG